MRTVEQKKTSGRAARIQVPCALTVAGSDSGGGAGIQADLKTFAAIGVHGTSAITAVTAQNPRGVRSIQGVRGEVIQDQIAMVFEELSPAAVKTGMLFTEGIVNAVAESLGGRKAPVVVDPVMIATSGALLLKQGAVRGITEKLFTMARIVTPNLHEAEHLLKRPLPEPEDLRSAAREMHERWGCAALVKGGHLRGVDRALDFYYDGQSELLLEGPFVRGVSTHGTGCTYSAAIAAHLAKGETLPRAVQQAKEFITNAIVQSVRCGRHDVLHPFWR